MASVTLAESAKLAQDMLIQGVIEDIVTVNQMFDVLPFEGIEGNSLKYNRENVLGDVQVAGVGTVITAKNPATFTSVNSNLTTILGDAEVNGLIQATRSNRTNQQAQQISSKAKSCGRKYQDMLINGTGSGDEFPGLLSLASSSKVFAAGTNGANFDLSILDQLIDLVTDKDGELDFFAMNARTIRAFYAQIRALGGASINEVLTLPSGRRVPQYRGIPVLRNDYIPTNQTQGTATTCTSILAGTVDDGSMMHGIAGLTAADAAGIQVVDVGESETKDERITRVKWYTGLALYSANGLAIAKGILN